MPIQQISPRQHIVRPLAAALIGLAALAGASHAMAAGTKSGVESSTYKQERAACMDGSSNQDKQTCLREAGAARYEASRGKLADPSQTSYKENALKRCEGLPQSDRVECQKRIDGGGTTEGTARDGGILRKSVTIVPGTPSATN